MCVSICHKSSQIRATLRNYWRERVQIAAKESPRKKSHPRPKVKDHWFFGAIVACWTLINVTSWRNAAQEQQERKTQFTRNLTGPHMNLRRVSASNGQHVTSYSQWLLFFVFIARYVFKTERNVNKALFLVNITLLKPETSLHIDHTLEIGDRLLTEMITSLRALASW